jgi:hypothetical protein
MLTDEARLGTRIDDSSLLSTKRSSFSQRRVRRRMKTILAHRLERWELYQRRDRESPWPFHSVRICSCMHPVYVQNCAAISMEQP